MHIVKWHCYGATVDPPPIDDTSRHMDEENEDISQDKSLSGNASPVDILKLWFIFILSFCPLSIYIFWLIILVCVLYGDTTLKILTML
jgi:hypothetical protein